MSNQWLRLWHDMPNDPKWRTIARISGQPISLVQSVFLHLLVSASQHVTRGHVDVTPEDLASALDVTEEEISSVLKAMEGRVIEGNYLLGWDKRQPKKEDQGNPKTGAKSAAERKREQRAREKARQKTKQDEPDNNASHDKSRNVTTDKDKDKDKEYKNKSVLFDEKFEEFWQTVKSIGWHGNIGSKQDAKKRFVKLKPDDTLISQILESIKRNLQVVKSNAEINPAHFEQTWKNLSGWLNNRCWEDDPPPTAQPRAPNTQQNQGSVVPFTPNDFPMEG